MCACVRACVSLIMMSCHPLLARASTLQAMSMITGWSVLLAACASSADAREVMRYMQATDCSFGSLASFDLPPLGVCLNVTKYELKFRDENTTAHSLVRSFDTVRACDCRSCYCCYSTHALTCLLLCCCDAPWVCCRLGAPMLLLLLYVSLLWCCTAGITY